MKYHVQCYQLQNVNRLMNIKNSKELFGYYNTFNLEKIMKNLKNISSSN